jgi:hypothetical protein
MTLATSSTNTLCVNRSDAESLLARLCDWRADVVYLPVRHHSPMCADIVARLIEQLRPAAVLIEGPSDYNPYLDELLLDHQLPIAIYSYFQLAGGASSGAYYPFCEYSPEWSALQASTRSGATVRFIDLPWMAVARIDPATHRYADAELRRGRYVEALCRQMEAEDFDDLWDKLIESHDQLSVDDYLSRVHSLCFHIRLWDEQIALSDRRREAFMAEQIWQTRDTVSGPVLVVTGGYHSSALAARLESRPCPGLDDDELQTTDRPEVEAAADTAEPVAGIALTSYSYERLDNLTGYNAGMPSPGFYEHAWRQRQAGQAFLHQPLLLELVQQLRQRKQTLSTADLIAVETSARALAALRGRHKVWRRDLIDAVTSALIKDELEYGCQSPFVSAVQAVLRGGRRGRLAAGTRLPPLALEIQRQLSDAGIEMHRSARQVELDLLAPADLAKSRLLHRLRLLDVKGIDRSGGTDFVQRDDLTRLWEQWRIRWSPEFDSSCIEASRYGTSLVDAAAARLQEIAREQLPSAAVAAELLVRSAQAGIAALSESLLSELKQLVEQESDFCQMGVALGHIEFLFCFEESFQTQGRPELGEILRSAFDRSLWLLELIGGTVTSDRRLLAGMQTLLDVFERAAPPLAIDRDTTLAVLDRVQRDPQKPPQVRGAAAGMLWTLDAASADQVLADLLLLVEPDDLGDYLTGLFALAREVAQRHPQLVRTIDRLLLEFSSDHFQRALPSLRLAFTYFTPREKHYMLGTLFESLGIASPSALPRVAVDEATAAEALALDERITEAIARYGLEAN